MEHEPFTTPLDGNDPEVLSTTIGSGPFSLLYGAPFDPHAPAPTYLTTEFLNRPIDNSMQGMLTGFQEEESGELRCVDQRVLNNQKGIIMDVIRKVAACLLKGKGIVGMSLPIRLFEPRSTIERLLDRWSYAPVYYENVMEQPPFERFKRSVAMIVAGLSVRPTQEKPFNPLLGETL